VLGVDSGAGAGFFALSGKRSEYSKLLTAAFERYTALTFPHVISAGAGASSASGTPALTSLKVSVASLAEDFPQLETDESYELTIAPTSGATLTANTVFGALRGLETFSQMVVFDFDSEAYTLPYAPWQISDTPRFPHRGLMIDSARFVRIHHTSGSLLTSTAVHTGMTYACSSGLVFIARRHFQPIATIKKLIDSLTYAKLNVLHWHMSDTQSFPFEVTGKAAGLWKGAFSSQEKFTQLDVRGVVEYARLRGVRVIVEFDMPGHAGSWCTAHPEICPSASCREPLNVANNATFELIEDLLQQCTGGVASAPGKPSPGVFKDNFVHLGGDEVNTYCWTRTPAIAAWLTEQKMTADDGYAYFVKRVAEIAIAQGHRPVQWCDPCALL
jgi:hexosaminidase